MIGVLFSFALAADGVSDAPARTTLSLPAEGIVRVQLPPEIVGAKPAALDATLRLRDTAGVDVAFTVAVTEPLTTETERLDVWPTGDHEWRVGPSSRPVQTLHLDYGGSLIHPIRVMVDNLGQATFATGLIDGEEVTLDAFEVPSSRGPWIVRSDLHLYGATGESRAPEYVPPICESAEALTPPALTESGFARYAVDLGGPRRVQSVRVLTPTDMFDRNVMVAVPTEARDQYGSSHRIRRVTFGGAAIDRSTISDLDLATDALAVDIATDDGRLLAVTGFEVCSQGAELVLRDAGAGPHTLFVGATPRAGSSDLAYARVDLLRNATTSIAAPIPEPNPDYIAEEEREGVDVAGSVLPLVRWRWQRPIVGEGWLRVPLDREVLANGRPDLRDVRVVDAEGRQVPFVLRRTGRETVWETGDFTREEEGSASLIRVPLGNADAPVATVRLYTSRNQFARQVTILRDRGAITEPLRSVRWVGDEQGGALAVAIDDIVGRELLVRIENGDNAALTVSSVEVTFPEWELRAHVPPNSRLIYGAPGMSAPTYDLSLLTEKLLQRRLDAATLGEPEAISGPVLAAGQRFIVLAAVGTLALALLIMVVRLIASGRENDDPGSGAATEPTSGP